MPDMTEKYFAGGFLFHASTRKVLLQWRGSKTSSNPNRWCFLGGWSEEEDRGDPAVTWCREMREEIGVAIDPRGVVPLCDYVPASSPYHRYIFYCDWPAVIEDFPLPQDEEDLAAVRWFTVEEALALPDLLTGGTALDLRLFQRRLEAT
jgi:8-oxo-dGTP pyrophosphatase MutT (NUDIX family)